MNTSRHRRQERKRRITLAVLLLMALSLMLSMLTSAPADAHGEEIVGGVYPADESVLLTTPGSIQVRVPGTDPVDIVLTDAAGNVIAFTGEPVRKDGLVSARPPTLEAGTYLIVWDDGGERVSSFSIGRKTATVSTDGMRDGAGIGAVGIAAGLHVAAFGLGLLLMRSSSRRRVAAAMGSGVAVLGAAVSFGVPSGASGALISLALLLSSGAALLAGMARGRGGLSSWGFLGGASVLALAPLGIGLFNNGLDAVTSIAGALSVLGLVVVALVVAPLTVAGTARAARADEQATSRPSFAIVVTIAAALLAAAPALASGRAAEVAEARMETESLEECIKNPNRLQVEHCLEASITLVAEESGVIGALERLEGLVVANSKARYYCHETSHAIGRASLRINGGIADAFRDGYDVCDFGYYHGIVEGAAAGLDDASFRELARTVCTDFANSEQLFFMQCAHGVGHAAARRTNNDMLRSLDFCEALTEIEDMDYESLYWVLFGCGTGVTMEWFGAASKEVGAAVLPEVSEPRDVCNLVPEKWAEHCFEYVGNTVDSNRPVASLSSIANWCETTAYMEACYRGVARAGAGLAVSDSDMVAICDLSSTAAGRNGCVRYYLVTVATTIAFDVGAVDRICRSLPEKDRSGPLSLCATTREMVVEVLAGGDGKERQSQL